MYRYICSLLIISLLACSSAKVLNTEKADDIDFKSYKTFDFYKIEARGDTVSQLFNDRIEKLENAIALRLQQSGYLNSKTNPDLLVNIGLVVNEKVQTRDTDFRTDAPRYMGQRRYSWKSKQVEVGTYKEGTVTVDLVDRQQNKLVWTGTVQDIIPEKESGLEKAISRGVKKLFADFPNAAK